MLDTQLSREATIAPLRREWHSHSINVKAIWRLLRPRHWIKNAFVLAPAFFAGTLFIPKTMLALTAAAVSWCAIASAVYALNDLADFRRDQHHPEKRDRPIAAGLISQQVAIAVSIILALVAAMAAVIISADFLVYIAAYAVLNVIYSVSLKRVPFVDVSVIAAGFVLRVLAGGVAAGVPVTTWLVVLTFEVTLLLAIGKRKCEFVRTRGDAGARAVFALYSRNSLDRMFAVVCIATILTYCCPMLLSVLFARTEQIHTAGRCLTILPMVLGVGRYSQQVVRGAAEAPTRLLLNDRWLQLILCVWLTSFVALLYA